MQTGFIDSIIFDLDGTLWDASASCTAAWNEALGQAGYSDFVLTEETIRSFSGLKIEDIFGLYFNFIPTERQTHLLNLYKQKEAILMKDRGGVLYPGVPAVLDELKKTYRLFIVSNCLAGYIENFLDLSHLAFVHAGILGEEPHTEIKSYSVDPLPEGGIIATGCKVYQPKPSPVDSHGFDVDYVYAVLRPYIVVLYKANPIDPTRKDMIALLVQPVTEESCIAHMLTCYPPYQVEPPAVRRFQQFIFGQDRPILENQHPKRLPLDPQAELHQVCDRLSVGYRRYLREQGWGYGTELGGG